jgi:hypothetical protein
VKASLDGCSKGSPDALLAASDEPNKLVNYQACVQGLKASKGDRRAARRGRAG